MVPAGRFGAAVLLAEVHASEYRTADEAAPVHQARTGMRRFRQGKSQQRLHLVEREDDGRGVAM